MADKDEVEPTDESDSTPPSDASVDPSDERPGSEPHEVTAADAEPVDPEPVGPEAVDPEPLATSEGEGEPEVGDRELEPAGVAALPAVGAAGGALTRERAQSRKAKETATRRRDQPVKPERTGPVKFIRESVGELRKVVYPTGQQLMSYFVVVLVFVLFIIAYVGLLDLGLGWVLFRVFGGES